MSSSRRDRDGDHDSYQPRACNLCWKEVQAPFLVTSCNHLFCMSHRDHEAIQQSSCPGCGHHLSSKGGLKQANYGVKDGDLRVLNGVTPEAALKVAHTAIKFWVTQERLQLQCAQHDAQDAKNRKNEQKEMFEEAYNEVKNQAAMAVADKEQAQQQADELVRENQVLQQKWQHAEQRARMLEEKMVGLKRGRESPLQRSPSPARPLEPQHQPPMHGQATGQPQMFSPLRAQSGLLPQQSPFSPTHQRSRLGVSSAPINPSPSLRQQTPLLHQRLSSPSLSHTPRTDLRGQRPGGLSVSGLGRTSF